VNHAQRTRRGCTPSSRCRPRSVLRSELGHRKPDEEDKEADQRPAIESQSAAVVPRLSEGREAAAEDADDRERNREVGEPAPTAVELLFVAEGGEPLLVDDSVLELSLIGPSPSFGPVGRGAIDDAA